jgi:RNA polymerase sigma-70 factor (ECF subfamily)
MVTRKGDVGREADFRSFYQREFGRVYRATYVACGGKENSEDATQEAFARAFERWARLGSQPWAVGWVIKTAINIARRASRRRKPPVEPPVPPAEPSDRAIDLWRAVGALPDRQREAVVFYYLADLPVVEVASLMRCKAGTVRAHLDRARNHLSAAMERSDHER